ncbi:hypothetical protein A4G20_06710 [Pasteurellaceae bacterium RH1A]|nr:hypothetical protein A4G20_06710 [Pasteurellaceae bacterium RH1A]
MQKTIRKSVRVRWDAYQNGCYFVTICTKDKFHYFGEISNNVMHLSLLGLELQNIIQNTPLIRPDLFIEIPIFVVIPNHVHFIITINHEIDHHQHYFGSQSKNLSAIVRGIKGALTSFAKKNGIPFQWQPRFHEHIIQNERAFNYIYDYVENNVINWANDCFY